MFGGIVETTGIITKWQFIDGCQHMTITPAQAFNDINIGDSIAVNGVCLTVTQLTPTSFDATAVPETLRLTNLSQLNLHSEVNLERSLKYDSRIGGHYMQGHVDGMGEIISLEKDNSDALLVKISIPEQFAKYIVPKGFITLDGMSITLIETNKSWFTVTLIPHTQAVTIAKNYKVGSKINLEVDMMGKYIEKLVGAYLDARAS